MSYLNDRFPGIWCPGCTISIALKQLVTVFEQLGFKEEELCVVSGIGCSGRAAGYTSVDSVHTCHGRALPVAEGIKRSNEKLNVVVFSGDGDLLGIGGNHLLHTSRRNVNITVICLNNDIYGMTGGQLAPTSEKGKKTVTSPYGSTVEPISAFNMLKDVKGVFYARTTGFHIQHMKEVMKEALEWKGFSFVEIRTMCPTNEGISVGDVLKKMKESYEIKDMINGDFDLGWHKND